MLKCLVVDDNEIHREIVEMVLADEGITSQSAENAMVALEACSKAMPDIIVLDWMMPKMSGAEFLMQLSRDYKGNIPYVIMCTAKGESSQSINSYLAGAAISMGSMDFLAKPFYADALREKILNAVDMLGGRLH